MRQLTDSLVILLCFLIVFLLSKTSLMELIVPVLGILVSLYLIVSFVIRENKIKDLFHAFLVTCIILLLTTSSGNLTSPFFFLLFFLPFALTFLLTPEAPLAFGFGCLLLFLPRFMDVDLTKAIIEIGSLLALCPLAFYFGREYQEEMKMRSATASLVKTITKDIGKIVKDDKKVLTRTETSALTEMLDEVNKFQKSELATNQEESKAKK